MSPTLSTLALPSGEVALRRAKLADLPAIVGLLADDPLGSSRETATPEADLQPYRDAFGAIDADPAQLLVVATAAHDVVGTMQLSFIPGLSRRGALRSRRSGCATTIEARDWGVRCSTGQSMRHAATAALWSS